MRQKKLIELLILSAVLLIAGATLTPASADNHIEHRESVIDEDGVEFEATFYSNLTVVVNVNNATNSPNDGRFNVRISDTLVARSQYNSSIRSTQEWEFELEKHQNPIRESQEVVISTFGEEISHTYRQTPTAHDSDKVKMAEIVDLDLKEGSNSGVDLIVTLKDESIHKYTIYVVAHTESTQKEFDRPNLDDTGNDSVRLSLHEDPNETVRGEVRLYTLGSDEMNTSLDMVEFEGTVDGEVEVDDVEFEPRENPGFYQYGNYGDEDNGGSDAVSVDDSSTIPIEIHPDELELLDDGTPTDTAIALGILGGGFALTVALFLVGSYRRLR